MTQQPQSRLNLHGAVDLSSLARPAAPAGAPAGGAAGAPAGAFVVDVTEDTFNDVLQQSMTVPVVIDLWAEWCGPCKQLSPVLEKLAGEYAGRFLLAKVDVDANPRISQAFQAQSIPMVVALIKGQPVPMFTGAVPEAQARQVLDELLDVAAQNGVSGTLAAAGEAPLDDEAEVEPELPPLHAAAVVPRLDGVGGAVRAFEQALLENPADPDAKAGIAQAGLFKRVSELPTAVQNGVRAAAAAEPANVEANLAVADLDLFGGHVEDAFDRVVDLVRVTSGDERATARTRLLEYFEIVGPGAPRVAPARPRPGGHRPVPGGRRDRSGARHRRHRDLQRGRAGRHHRHLLPAGSGLDDGRRRDRHRRHDPEPVGSRPDRRPRGRRGLHRHPGRR